MKKYFDFTISGDIRGCSEIGALAFKNNTLVNISDTTRVGCYANSYSSRDYLELNVAEVLVEKPDYIFYKISRTFEVLNKHELSSFELNVSIPNHLKHKTQDILKFFDINKNNIKYTNCAIVKYFDIEEALFSKEDMENKTTHYMDISLKELFPNNVA